MVQLRKPSVHAYLLSLGRRMPLKHLLSSHEKRVHQAPLVFVCWGRVQSSSFSRSTAPVSG